MQAECQVDRDRDFADRIGPEGEPADHLDQVSEPPPPPVGQDERRMQVRAYNHWTSLLRGRRIPAITDLDPARLHDFELCSVLLDFSGGAASPAVRHLGGALAAECGAQSSIATLADVPAGSLLSEVNAHYPQLAAKQAPLRFEAEFVNQRGATILYRGILLPFAGAGGRVTFLYAVVNWKELADQPMTEALLLEIGQALAAAPPKPRRDALTDWADAPQTVPAPAVFR